jgi:hypothetical protein
MAGFDCPPRIALEPVNCAANALTDSDVVVREHVLVKPQASEQSAVPKVYDPL